MGSVVGRVQVVNFRDIQRVVEHAFVFGIEPAIDIGVQERTGHVEQEGARHQRDRDKSEDQARLQFRSDKSAAALEKGLGEVAPDQHQHQAEQEEAQVEEQDDDQVRDQRSMRT